MAKIYNDISGEQEQTSQSMKGYDHTRFSNDRRYMQLVLLAAHYYDNMSDLRKKWKRDIDYSMGRQLNDTVVYNGHTIRVHDYMELRGMPALSNDIITDKMVTMKGLVRQQYMAPTVKSVDSRLLYGISPAGNIKTVRRVYFADVTKWQA